MNKLIGVCWSITDKCNLNCPICCRYIEEGGLSISEKFKLIQRVHDNEIRKLNFAGGEPLLEKDLLSLVEYSKSLGLKTALSTNGILLSRPLMQSFEEILDEIQLPLDGPNAAIHSIHRGSRNHFQVVQRLIPEITQHGYKVDISTVVTAQNSRHLDEMGSFLDRSGITKWKLFHFNPVGTGHRYREKFMISASEFSRIANKILSTITSIDFDAGIANEERLYSYFNISPLGHFYFAGGGRFTVHGNVLDHENLHDLAQQAGFNYAHHSKRFWRDCSASGT